MASSFSYYYSHQTFDVFLSMLSTTCVMWIPVVATHSRRLVFTVLVAPVEQRVKKNIDLCCSHVRKTLLLGP